MFCSVFQLLFLLIILLSNALYLCLICILSIKFTNIRQLMLKLSTHSGFHDIFLNSILSRARGEGYNLLISANPCQNSKPILASMIYFDSDMSKSTNTVVYFDWKTAIYIYITGKCRTQFMLPMEKSVTFTGACANEIIPSINRSFVYKAKEGSHVRIINTSFTFVLSVLSFSFGISCTVY